MRATSLPLRTATAKPCNKEREPHVVSRTTRQDASPLSVLFDHEFVEDNSP